jgi:hypothetical protein
MVIPYPRSDKISRPSVDRSALLANSIMPVDLTTCTDVTHQELKQQYVQRMSDRMTGGL